MNKKEIRSYIKDLKMQLTSEQILEYSDKIKERLFIDLSFLECSHLFCYVSFNQEVRTEAIIEYALSNQIKVAVPKIVTNEMKFFYINSLDDLNPGILGILEPVSGVEAVPDNANKNLVLVPGLAFDTAKNRIGYGKGYYDSFFEKYKTVPMTKTAFAYDFQVLEHIPSEQFDRKVDQIITNTGIIL